VGCRYHLAIAWIGEEGRIFWERPDAEIWELEETCALDIVERLDPDSDGLTLGAIADVMRCTRERVRQIEAHGLRAARANATHDLSRAALVEALRDLDNRRPGGSLLAQAIDHDEGPSPLTVEEAERMRRAVAALAASERPSPPLPDSWWLDETEAVPSEGGETEGALEAVAGLGAGEVDHG
jgi:hypothetical protein